MCIRDSCDFSIKTIDGFNTFHYMTGIKCVTPEQCVLDTLKTVKKMNRMKQSALVEKKGIVQVKPFEFVGESGLSNYVFKNVYELYNSKKYNGLPSTSDFVWMVGKFLDKHKVPGWQGYMEKIFNHEDFDVTKILATPFIMAPPSDIETIYTCLKMATEEADKINVHTVLATFDLPLFIKATELVLSDGPGGELHRIVVRLGGFHLLMSFLGCIGFIMSDSGLKELLCTIYAPNSVDHILKGDAFARAVRAHLLVQLALSKVILKNVDLTDDEIYAVNQIFENFTDKKKQSAKKSDIEENVYFKNIASKLEKELKNKEENGPTTKLWLQYFHRCV